MIDFDSAIIWFDCARCDGNAGQFPGGFCEDCCNSGEWPFYLGTLFTNLAIAGALAYASDREGAACYCPFCDAAIPRASMRRAKRHGCVACEGKPLDAVGMGEGEL